MKYILGLRKYIDVEGDVFVSPVVDHMPANISDMGMAQLTHNTVEQYKNLVKEIKECDVFKAGTTILLGTIELFDDEIE